MAARQRVGFLNTRSWATALGLAAALACSPIQRHDVLDFFLDGVPPYLTPEERERFAAEEAARAAEEEASPRETGRAVRKLSRFIHGPFAADECWRCHDLVTTSGFRQFRGTGGPGAASRANLAEGGRLKRPVGELCIHCHADFAAEAPENEDLWVHGPVASGWCVLCHQPHSSVYSKLLYDTPSNGLCNRCHLPDTLLATSEHLAPLPRPDRAATETGEEAEPDELDRVATDCTRCHDPHRGPDRMILRPRDEWEGGPASTGGTHEGIPPSRSDRGDAS